MGERRTEQWVQFTCFKTKITVGEELFQETWIPLSKVLKARGINLVVLSKKVNAKDDINEYALISKTWWDAVKAIQGAFQGGLQATSISAPRAAICTAQVGCFRVKSTRRSNEELDPNRHETLVEDETKVYIMTTQPLSSDEINNKAETLCLVRGFQSYCIYELDHSAFPEEESGFYSWIVEVYVQSFFKDSVLEEIRGSGQFKDWDLVVHQDVVKFSM